MIIVYIFHKQYSSTILVWDKNFSARLDTKYHMWNNVKLVQLSNLQYIRLYLLSYQLTGAWNGRLTLITILAQKKFNYLLEVP